jgi:hypothetical protein
MDQRSSVSYFGTCSHGGSGRCPLCLHVNPMPRHGAAEAHQAPLTVPGQTTFEDDLESGRLAIKGYTDYLDRTTSGEEGGR